MVMAFQGGTGRKARLQQRTRAAVIWGLSIFLVLQGAFYFPLSSQCPQMADPEYGLKRLHLLEALSTQKKDQPFVMALGTSLTGMALRPDTLTTCRPNNPDGPLVYNFGINGSLSVLQLVYMKRLLGEGIHPDCVLLEVCPRLYLSNESTDPARRQNILTQHIQYQDFPVLSRYHWNTHQVRTEWRKMKVSPWYSHRSFIQDWLVPSWVPKDQRMDRICWRHFDPWGWELIAELIEEAKKTYRSPDWLKNVQDTLAWWNKQDYNVDLLNALRETVKSCQDARIRVIIVRMPESSYFRAGYSKELRGRFVDCLADLQAATGVTVVNAEDWVSDDAEFCDGFHVTDEGATSYTRRLESEVIRFITKNPADYARSE
jgi:hypothetical protein